MEQCKEIANRFKAFCEAGHGDCIFIRLGKSLDTFKVDVEQDGDEVLHVQLRDGAVRKVTYMDEGADLKRQDKFDSNGVLDSVHQKRDGDREGLQVDRKGDEWELNCRTKTLSNDFQHFLLGPGLGDVSEGVTAAVALVDPQLFAGLDKEKVYLEKEDDHIVVQIGKGKRATKYTF